MASERAIGIGLIGCGTIGQIHADGFAKLVADGEIRAVAAADPSPEARAAASRNCRFERLHIDGATVIADPDVEAILVASPTASHRDLVRSTLAAGKAVLCEKPLAPDFATVRELDERVAAASVTAQVGFHSRFHYLFCALRELLESRELGAPMGYALREDQYWPTGDVVPGHSSWRSDRVQSGGGALLEHTIHGADVVCWLFGPATRVSSRTRSVFGYDVEDAATAVVEHADGTIGTILTIFNGVRGREERRLEVFFERGAVECTADFVVGAPEDGLLVQRPDAPAERPDLLAMRDAHLGALGVSRRDFLFPTYVADRAWVGAVREHRAGWPGFRDGLAAHALVEAAYRSAASGEPTECTGDLSVPAA